MAAKSRSDAPVRRVFDAPLHVVPADDGTVTIFFPDGSRMSLTEEAAARSAMLLSRASVAQRAKAAGRSRRSAKIIPFDFTSRPLTH